MARKLKTAPGREAGRRMWREVSEPEPGKERILGLESHRLLYSLSVFEVIDRRCSGYEVERTSTD